MPQFMADDIKNLVGRSFLDCRVPDDHSFRTPESGYVRVDFVGLGAGLHEEHAIYRNWNTCVSRQFPDRINERRLFLLQRPKRVKHWIDQPRTNEENEQRDGHDRKPKIKPPRPWFPTDNREQNPNEEKSDGHYQQLS